MVPFSEGSVRVKTKSGERYHPSVIKFNEKDKSKLDCHFKMWPTAKKGTDDAL